MSSRSGAADTYNPGATTDSAQRSSTLRPRRLISFTDGDGDNNRRQPSSTASTGLATMGSSESPNVRSRGPTPSPRPSRTVSPMPMGHPSRETQPYGGARSGNSLDFLDASWSSLQSIASSLLGSDTVPPTSNGVTRSHARKPSRPNLYSRIPPRTSTWGPSGPITPEIGAGTLEERQAMVQAKKREALLLADTDPTWSLNNRHKRRDSSDQPAQLEIKTEQGEEALVYVHQVQPMDSITGVTIRYGCQAAIFRKANGFWPTDSIQVRKTVLLPVDCCSVKGRPLKPQETVDLLDDTPNPGSIEDPSGSSIVPAFTPEISPGLSEQTTEPEIESDGIWKHESWVQIDGFSAPVEIGRVSRRSLGFFPRSRRKSLCYSNTEPVRGRDETPTVSTASSPVHTTSPRPNDLYDRPSVASAGSRKPAWSRPTARHRRQQSGLELSGKGVGTLDRSVNMPGPAMDGLSKFFAQHLPTLTPKQAPPSFNSLNEFSSTAVSNNSTSLDNIGGAVEDWVRKMTARAKSSINDLQQGPSSPPNHGLPRDTGRSGLGDLIELDDGVESRNSSNLHAGSKWTEFNRSASNLSNGVSGSLRGRFPSASPSTSRSRTGQDRLKDD